MIAKYCSFSNRILKYIRINSIKKRINVTFQYNKYYRLCLEILFEMNFTRVNIFLHYFLHVYALVYWKNKSFVLHPNPSQSHEKKTSYMSRQSTTTKNWHNRWIFNSWKNNIKKLSDVLKSTQVLKLLTDHCLTDSYIFIISLWFCYIKIKLNIIKIVDCMTCCVYTILQTTL